MNNDYYSKIDAHNNAVKQIAKRKEEIRGFEKELISLAPKTPQQLREEFLGLATDALKWQWVRDNQGCGFRLYLGEYTSVIFGDLKSRGYFDRDIRWTDGVLVLLEAMGIKGNLV